MASSLDLAIKISADASDAAAGFDRAGAAATGMADQVDRASRDIDTAGNRMAGAADGADALASKTGTATGALGALAGGLEAVGLEKYAGALQATAIATDVTSGASDLFKLAMESEMVTNIKNTATKIRGAVASRAAAVATTAQTVAQRALNLAMRANPIGLIVTAVLLLVGAVVLAYKRSETFRRIVDAAFRAVQRAAQFAFDWVKKNWPLLLAIITGPIGLAVLAIVKNWDKIKAGAEAVVNWIRDKFEWLQDKVAGIGDRIRDAFVNGFDAIMAPVQAVIDLVQSLLDKIGSIDFPDIPDINPFRVIAGDTGTTKGAAPAGVSQTFNVTIVGATDPDATARQFEDMLDKRAARLGRA